MGLWAGLDGCGESRSHWDSIPPMSSSKTYGILPERLIRLPGFTEHCMDRVSLITQLFFRGENFKHQDAVL